MTTILDMYIMRCLPKRHYYAFENALALELESERFQIIK